MSKATTIQKIKDNVYENVNNEITGQMAQDAMVEIVNDTYTELGKKQDKLVSGTNIKTVQGQSLLGSGNVALSAGSLNAYTKSETDALLNTKVPKTTKVNGKALSGDITLTAADVNAYSKTETDAKFLPLAGGTMTGEVIFNGIASGNSAINVGGANITNIGTIVGKNTNNKQVLIETNTSGILHLSTQDTTTWSGSDTILSGIATPTANNHAANKKYVDTKQPALISGTNIKTVNNTTLLGSGNIAVQPTLVSGTNIKTINGVTLLGSGDIVVGSGIQQTIVNREMTTSDVYSAHQPYLGYGILNTLQTGNIVTLNYSIIINTAVSGFDGDFWFKFPIQPLTSTNNTVLISGVYVYSDGVSLSSSTIIDNIVYLVLDGKSSTTDFTGSITYSTTQS